jgi:hypothetical protein
MDLARMIVDAAQESQQQDAIKLLLAVHHRYEYEIAAIPCSSAVVLVYRTLRMRAETYESLVAILEFLAREIADDVSNNLRRDIQYHVHPPDREQGIAVDVVKKDTTVFQNYFRNGHLGSVLQRYMLPMWYARY